MCLACSLEQRGDNHTKSHAHFLISAMHGKLCVERIDEFCFRQVPAFDQRQCLFIGTDLALGSVGVDYPAINHSRPYDAVQQMTCVGVKRRSV